MSRELLERAWRFGVDAMDAADKLVLLSLADHHNGATGLCCPSRARIAERTGLDPRTVSRAIQRLERIGVIEPKRTFGRGSRYELRIPESTDNRGQAVTGDNAPLVTRCPDTGGTTPPPPGAPRPRTGGTTPHVTVNNRKGNRNGTIAPPVADAGVKDDFVLSSEPKAASRPKRANDLNFEALAELHGGHKGLTPAIRGSLNKALKDITASCADTGTALTPDEIKQRVQRIPLHYPSIRKPSAQCLAKYWHELRNDSTPRKPCGAESKFIPVPPPETPATTTVHETF